MNLIALQSPSYRRYFAGSAAAVNGLWILRVVVMWLAWQVSQSATFVGLISALSMIPTVITGPFFGVLMDRCNIIHAAYGTTIAMMSATLLIILAQYMGVIGPVFLIFLALYIGIITSAHHPMRLSLGPRLVERHQIGSVSALAALNFNMARAISPFIAGVVIANFGITAALILTLCLYLPNLYITGTLQTRDITRSSEHQSIRAAIVEGLAHIWADKYLRLILIASALFAFSIRAVFEILPVIADGAFNMGAIGLGQLGTAIGIGSLCAALFKTMGTSDRVSALSYRVIFIGIFGLCAMAFITTTTYWPLALIAAACMGFSGTFTGVSFQSEIQSDLPDDIRGRVMSLWGVIALGSVSLGSLIIGWLTDTIGLGQTGVIICAASIIAALWIARQSKYLP
jgi:predicted MFS family arabinose efflux permease